MKKTLLSLFIGFSLTAPVLADDLSQVYQLALQNDPIINRAKADKELAYSGIALSRANLLPQISGSVSYSLNSGDQVFTTENGFGTINSESDTLSMGLDLRMSIYDHANWVGMDRAEKVAQQGDANLASALQSLIVRVTNAYLAVLREQDSVEFVKAELRAIERQLEQTKQRFEVGLTAITDVHEAQANFDNTVARQIRAENQLELRLEELREITGKYHSGISILDTNLFTATQPTPANVEDWLKLAEDANFDLLIQRFAKDIAMEDIASAKAGHYPTLDFSASLSRVDRTTEVQGSDPRDFPTLNSQSLGLSLSVPIYQGGRVSTSTDQARSRYVIASENMELVYRQTVRSVRSSYNDVKAAVSTIRALEQSVVSADSALKATEAGFDVGTRTIVDVLNSTRNLFDARRNLADARYNFISAIINLKRAAGSLTEDDLLAVNRVMKPNTSN
ncbi:outer membrane channel protein TolC [Brumicola nitratireducens]|uniref:Outer membrane channel protein n=1 Tax=Glaciecola nitratireducens (strain JCM 12485 / KCTC 12276 / FR1064) TaxID=1085623 RepID=G4QMN0_GLANF|nr:outer membrane channel protein TolC [Glaciecola nitratireducens]AEP30982.1 outer membrane channel precursor protein [Glaciecola nitratireducens FR1064]